MSSTKWISSKTGNDLIIGSGMRQASMGPTHETYHAEIREVFQPHTKLPEDPDQPGREKHLNPNNIHVKITLGKYSNINKADTENVVFPLNISVAQAWLLYGSEGMAGRPCRLVCDPFKPHDGRVEIIQGVHERITPQSKSEMKQHGDNRNVGVQQVADAIGAIISFKPGA